MKGDFTRDTFKPEKHYQRVLMQQGRVQLDAEWNEQAAIESHRDETTTRDVVGPCGGSAENAAFRITPVAGSPGDFLLSAGRYYVDGVQCELERDLLFTQQPDLPNLNALKPGKYLIYLDVWQRHLTILDDAGIREVALGGPDTTTRVKTVWQVRATPTTAGNCVAAADELVGLARVNLPQLKARTALVKAESDPCVLPSTAGYRGLENQLYRVEIHEGSYDAFNKPQKPTFKWSRENGSVVTAITGLTVEGTKTLVTVTNLGPDNVLGFKADDIVELLDDSYELEGLPGKLAVIDGDPSNLIIKLKPLGTRPLPVPADLDLLRHPKLRRWEGKDVVGASRPVDNDGYLTLESGIEIRFDADGDGYRTGDYWLIPARSATADATSGDIEWPREIDVQGKPQPIGQSPRGISHHYCRLGVVSVDASGAVILESDCRCLWPALTSVPRLFYVSGDGQEVMPDLTAPPLTRFKLPRPLIVGVANAQCLERPTKVRFDVTAPSAGFVVVADGLPTASFVTVAIDDQGLAKCDFHLDGVNPNQQVTARLMDAAGHPVSLPIIFNANLSIASQVAYQPRDCAGLAGQKTVQDAIAHLANLASIYKVNGDGQQAGIGAKLSEKIQVRVANRCGPLAKMNVNFRVILGGGKVSPNASTTDVNGEATCEWQLGGDSILQLVEAELAGDAMRPTTEPTKVHFFAHLTGEGDNDPSPVRIVGIQLKRSNQYLQNDQRLTLDELPYGMRLLCDRPIDPETVNDPLNNGTWPIQRGQPTCFVTAEIPYPILPSEISDLDNSDRNDPRLIGYRPLVLFSNVTAERLDDSPPEAGDQKPRGQINWVPDESAVDFLQMVLNRLKSISPSPYSILLRLTLKGNFIWSTDAMDLIKKGTLGGYLDGETFRAFRLPNVLLPSGDNRRGGDFEMWFHLTEAE